MKKYTSFFRLRFSMGLQYRAAALAGMATQFFWGFMEILVFRAFYSVDSAAFPMTLQAACSYIWMQQAFLALFAGWALENDIFEGIKNGNVAYELCRPVGLYEMWFTNNAATRVSRAVLRCVPLLLVAALLPDPYGLSLPSSPAILPLFLLTMGLSLMVTVSFSMLIYTSAFFTISPDGIRMVSTSAVELLSGAIIPIPFFPDGIRNVLELLPFAAMQNVPLRIYTGDLSGYAAARAVILQVFWLIVMVTVGKWMMRRATKKIVVQGG